MGPSLEIFTISHLLSLEIHLQRFLCMGLYKYTRKTVCDAVPVEIISTLPYFSETSGFGLEVSLFIKTRNSSRLLSYVYVFVLVPFPEMGTRSCACRLKCSDMVRYTPCCDFKNIAIIGISYRYESY